MQTIDEVREHCRFVGDGIEKLASDGQLCNETDCLYQAR